MTESLRQDEFDRIFSTVPRLTVEVLITSEERGVLLALRDVDPCRGMWNLPGGTVRFGERLVDAVRRVAADELGIAAVHELTEERYRLPEVSRTFHARDIFAPAAAHLAVGVPIAELGPPLDPGSLVRIELPRAEVGRSQVRGSVLIVDRFGNVATNVRRAEIDALGLTEGDRVEVRLQLDRYYAVLAGTFADAPAGELIMYEDSYGLVSLAISQGNAARLTGVAPGDELRVART